MADLIIRLIYYLKALSEALSDRLDVQLVSSNSIMFND